VILVLVWFVADSMIFRAEEFLIVKRFVIGAMHGLETNFEK